MLAVLVEDFENRAYPISPSNPAVALRELMREHGLKQTDMVVIFGSPGTVSQVLNGKRDISKSQAKKLGPTATFRRRDATDAAIARRRRRRGGPIGLGVGRGGVPDATSCRGGR